MQQTYVYTFVNLLNDICLFYVLLNIHVYKNADKVSTFKSTTSTQNVVTKQNQLHSNVQLLFVNFLLFWFNKRGSSLPWL